MTPIRIRSIAFLLALAAGLGCGVAVAQGGPAKESSAPIGGESRTFDGTYYHEGLGFGFRVTGTQGIATVSNSRKYKPGDLMLRFTSTAPRSFKGDQLCTDGIFHPVTAVLNAAGNLDMTIQGCSPTQYTMVRQGDAPSAAAESSCSTPRDKKNQTCVETPRGVARSDDQCYRMASDLYFDALWKALAVSLLKDNVLKDKDNTWRTCVTYPYAGDLYEDVNSEVGNVVHAGIDYRASGVNVYSVEDGKVSYLTFCYGEEMKSGAGRCRDFVGDPRSTLIIENTARTRKVIYLHMKEIPPKLDAGSDVRAGDLIGIASDVGVADGGAHLHVEVWPASSPEYGRKRAISRSACPPSDKCSRENVLKFTCDPFVLVGPGIGPNAGSCGGPVKPSFGK